jgi:CRP-like cAMP-binding protein
MAQPPRTGRGQAPQLDCRTCPVARSAQWNALGGAELARLNESKVTTAYRAGETLFRQGTPCEGIHCLAHGSVALRRIGAQGSSVLISLVREGQTVGYRSYYNNRHHAEQAEVLEPSTICLVPNDVMAGLLDGNTALGRAFSTALADDLRHTEQALLDAVAQPVRMRIARLLQLLLDHFGEADPDGRIVLRLPFGRQEMADLLGIQRETVTRTLNALQADGVLRHVGRTVVVGDLDRLLDELGEE